MANRRLQGTVLAVLWVIYIVALVAIVVASQINHNYLRWQLERDFPHMPLYGAVTWWFFFAIPLIGFTWGFLNDLKGD